MVKAELKSRSEIKRLVVQAPERVIDAIEKLRAENLRLTNDNARLIAELKRYTLREEDLDEPEEF